MQAIFRLCRNIFREHRDQVFGEFFQPRNKPWMRYREIDVISELLVKLKPKSCLEWGAGYSTLFFPELLPTGAHWLAIEHDAEWAATIATYKPDAKAKIKHIAPNQFPWSDALQDGAYEDLRDYIEYAAHYAPFDFILVDGRGRNAYIRKARELLRPDGVVVLHDANRLAYHAETGTYPIQLFLRGYRKNAGGLWLGSLARTLQTVLDVTLHKKVWQLSRSLGKQKIKC